MMKKLARMEQQKSILSLLWDDLLLKILEKFGDAKTWRSVCKGFLRIESIYRKSITVLQFEFLPKAIGLYASIRHMDLSVCPRIGNEELSLISSELLRSINLSRTTGVDYIGLSSLVKKCPNLEEIDLSYCCGFGDLEAEAVSFAANLKSLSLVKCLKISDLGLVKIAVGCSKLRSLNLKWCIEITDMGIELLTMKCMELRFLDVSYLLISNKGLESIARIPKLKSLIMVGCDSVDDEGFDCLQYRATSLERIDVSRCAQMSASGVVSMLKGNKDLQDFSASYTLNDLTAPLLQKMKDLKSLKTIKLDACRLSSEALETIGRNCKNLSEISISKCRGISDEDFHNLVQNFPDLKLLDISCSNELTDASLISLASCCKNLESLKMESCSLMTTQNLGLERIGAECSNLRELDMTDCPVDDIGLKYISKCTKLRILKLGLCHNITSKGIAHISSNCKELEELDFYRCIGLNDDGLASLADGCRKLRSLNICYCARITNIGLKHVSRLNLLVELEMRSLRLITRVGVAAIAAGCTSLALLDVKGCHNIDDYGMCALAQCASNLRQLNISYCQINDWALLVLLSNLSCLQDVKMVLMTHVTVSGIAHALRAAKSLKKVKLSDQLKYLLPSDVIHLLETRGCRMRWIHKSRMMP